MGPTPLPTTAAPTPLPTTAAPTRLCLGSGDPGRCSYSGTMEILQFTVTLNVTINAYFFFSPSMGRMAFKGSGYLNTSCENLYFEKKKHTGQEHRCYVGRLSPHDGSWPSYGAGDQVLQ